VRNKERRLRAPQHDYDSSSSSDRLLKSLKDRARLSPGRKLGPHCNYGFDYADSE
jgi:hypothetical protein